MLSILTWIEIPTFVTLWMSPLLVCLPSVLTSLCGIHFSHRTSIRFPLSILCSRNKGLWLSETRELSKISHCIDLIFESNSLVPFLLGLRELVSPPENSLTRFIEFGCVAKPCITVVLEELLLRSVLIEVNSWLWISLHCFWIFKFFFFGHSISCLENSLPLLKILKSI